MFITNIVGILVYILCLYMFAYRNKLTMLLKSRKALKFNVACETVPAALKLLSDIFHIFCAI